MTAEEEDDSLRKGLKQPETSKPNKPKNPKPKKPKKPKKIIKKRWK